MRLTATAPVTPAKRETLSKDEQARIIGDSVQEYMDSKWRIAVRRAQLLRESDNYQKAAECLRAAAAQQDPQQISSVDVATLEQGRLEKLIADLQSELFRHASLLGTIKAFGIQIQS
jgi:chromosome condensin MukBEF complex kleisin-like MukF subunit